MDENIFKKMDVKGIMLNNSYTKKYNEILDKSIEKFENEVNKNNDLLKIIGDKGAHRVKSFSLFSDKFNFLGFSLNLDIKNESLKCICNNINLHSESFLINQIKTLIINNSEEEKKSYNIDDNLYSEINIKELNNSNSLIGVLHSTPCLACTNEIISFNKYSDKKIKLLFIGFEINAKDKPTDINKNSTEGIFYNNILYKGKEVISVLKLLLDNGITPIIHNRLRVGNKTIFLSKSTNNIVKLPKESNEDSGTFDDKFYIVTYKNLEKIFENEENTKSFISNDTFKFIVGIIISVILGVLFYTITFLPDNIKNFLLLEGYIWIFTFNLVIYLLSMAIIGYLIFKYPDYKSKEAKFIEIKFLSDILVSALVSLLSFFLIINENLKDGQNFLISVLIGSSLISIIFIIKWYSLFKRIKNLK